MQENSSLSLGPMDARLSIIFRVFFLFPVVVLMVTQGSIPASRIAQAAWLFVTCLLLLRWRRIEPLGFSLQAKVLSIAICGFTSIAFIRGLIQPNFFVEIDDLTRAYSVALILLAADLHRRLSLSQFFAPMRVTSLLIVVICIVHLALFRTEVWGRALFFGLHPNLGGATLLSAIIVLAFSRFSLVNFCAIIVAVYGIVVFQSRGALLVAAIVTLIYVCREIFMRGPGRLDRVVAFLFFVSCVCLISVSYQAEILSILHFFLDDIMLINDPLRGMGSGLSGRLERIDGFSALRDSPLIGIGIGNASWGRDQEISGHNGFLILFLEFGAAAFVFLALATLALFRHAATDVFVFTVMVALMGLYWLEPRTLSLSPFPMFLWLLLLPFRFPSSLTSSNLIRFRAN